MFSDASKASLCAQNLLKMDVAHFMEEATKNDSSPLKEKTGLTTNENHKSNGFNMNVSKKHNYDNPYKKWHLVGKLNQI